jgi:hypothetical protein
VRSLRDVMISCITCEKMSCSIVLAGLLKVGHLARFVWLWASWPMTHRWPCIWEALHSDLLTKAHQSLVIILPLPLYALPLILVIDRRISFRCSFSAL